MYELMIKIFLTFLILAVLVLPFTYATWRGPIVESFLGTYLRYMATILFLALAGLFIIGVTLLLKLIWG